MPNAQYSTEASCMTMGHCAVSIEHWKVSRVTL
jgi:hypothetical protein